jgi:hypothetical protein
MFGGGDILHSMRGASDRARRHRLGFLSARPPICGAFMTEPSPTTTDLIACTCADRIAISERVLRLIEVNRINEFEAMEAIAEHARSAGGELARAFNVRFDRDDERVPF